MSSSWLSKQEGRAFKIIHLSVVDYLEVKKIYLNSCFGVTLLPFNKQCEENLIYKENVQLEKHPIY